MKRDMDLIRELLIAIEARPLGEAGTKVKLEGHDEDTVAYHLALLHEASLIEGNLSYPFGSAVPRVIVYRLTWHGHEFLDAARNQTVWARTKAIVREKGGDVSFAIFRELLIGTARANFGLS